MKALLIPVKNLAHAKQRLAPWLSQSDRTALAAAMFDDFCAAVVRARGMDAIFLISNHEPAIERAESYGWQIIREGEQHSESASVDAASQYCAARGVTALARVPIDLPLIAPQDIQAIFDAAHPAPSTVIVPSRDGTGTNTLLRTPPALFPSHFGPNSFPKHLAEAARCGAERVILRNERLEFDVDDWDDLQLLAARADLPPATEKCIARLGLRASAPHAAHADAAHAAAAVAAQSPSSAGNTREK